MNDEQIKALAKRLTENCAHHSVCLGLPEGGPMRRAADKFFAERELWGVRGWATEEEAEKMIRANQAKQIIDGTHVA